MLLHTLHTMSFTRFPDLDSRLTYASRPIKAYVTTDNSCSGIMIWDDMT